MAQVKVEVWVPLRDELRDRILRAIARIDHTSWLYERALVSLTRELPATGALPARQVPGARLILRVDDDQIDRLQRVLGNALSSEDVLVKRL